jgi:DNA-binding phage protein
MTDDKKLAKEIGQELALRLGHMKPENLEEPKTTLADNPEYRIVRDAEMTLVQKKLVTLSTQILYDVLEMKEFAHDAIAAKDQELVNEILGDIKKNTAMAKVVNSVLKRSLEKQGITAPLEKIEFLAGWQIAVKKSQSNNVLIDREPTLDRKTHLLGTVLGQAGLKLRQVADPLYGTKFKSKKKKDMEPMN